MIKKILLYVMALGYIVAGINHFWHPQMYLKIVPHFLPLHEALNYLTGVLEILLGFLLFPKVTRNIAAWGLAILLVLIFPANIQMAIDYTKENHPQKWLTYLRLPLQFLLIWWALQYTNLSRTGKLKSQLFHFINT
jgi:uncharacterized membrane protein